MIRPFIRPAAATAVALVLAACGQQDQPTRNDPETGDVVEEAADDIGDAAETVGEEVSAAVDDAVDSAAKFAENELSQSNALGFTARNVMGASVRDINGDVAAIVDDLLFDDMRIVRAVVVRDGAFMGLGGDEAIISADKFAFYVDEDREMVMTVDVTDGELKQMTESLAYEPTDGVINPGNLVSVKQFLSRPIDNINGDKVADPFDILLAEPGQWDTLILSVGGIGAIGNRLVAIDSDTLKVNDATGTLYLDYAAPDLDALPTFEYE